MAQSRKGGSNGSNGPMSMAAGSTRDGTSLHRACAAPPLSLLSIDIDVLDAMRVQAEDGMRSLHAGPQGHKHSGSLPPQSVRPVEQRQHVARRPSRVRRAQGTEPAGKWILSKGSRAVPRMSSFRAASSS